MSNIIFDTSAPKKSANLSINADLLQQAKQLNPQFKIKGVAAVMPTAELAGISIHSLGDKVTSLKTKRNKIITALDLLRF